MRCLSQASIFASNDIRERKTQGAGEADKDGASLSKERQLGGESWPKLKELMR